MKLTEITLDLKLMMRVSLNQEIIDEYAQNMLDGDQFPPIIIFNDGDHNYLVEGFKRYYAKKKNGAEIIDADVRMGTYDDAFDYALTVANRLHGERYTQKDKRYQLQMALDMPRYANKSDRELGRILKVSHTFVSNARKAIGKQPDVIATTRKGKPVAVKNTKPEPEIIEDDQDKIEEIATEMQGIIRENEELQNRLAVAAMEATDEEKQLAKSLLEDKDEKIRMLEADNRVLKASRDSFQREASELKKQIRYWESRAKRAEAALNKKT
jgi:hypothetical protein